MARARIGTSGYQYDHWKGGIYPEKASARDYFAFYAERFDTVEINNTFYNLPAETTFRSWKERAPQGFLYALKYSRYATHLKKLKDPEAPLTTFLERARLLEDRLATLLVQLPPNWRPNPERLDAFLDLLPQDISAAVEFRDAGWLNETVFDVLQKHDAALVVHDMLPEHPDRTTASFAYYRFHGIEYDTGYSPQKLSAFADRVAELTESGRDVFAYFNNDLGGHAPEDAQNLRRYLRKRDVTC